MPAPFINIHGRKPTRGLRPWLLIPKILAVAVYFGALFVTLVLWLVRGFVIVVPNLPAVLDSDVLSIIRLLFYGVCLPALGVATLFGVLLFFQHPAVFLRQRWWQLKMVLLATGTPLGELLVVRGLVGLRRGYDAHIHGYPGASMLTTGLVCLLVVAAALIVLGRQKPRLGQNWAKAFPKSEA